MSNLIATWSGVNSVAGGTISSDYYRCPTYSEINARSEVGVSAVYDSNQCVRLDHVVKKDQRPYNTVTFRRNGSTIIWEATYLLTSDLRVKIFYVDGNSGATSADQTCLRNLQSNAWYFGNISMLQNVVITNPSSSADNTYRYRVNVVYG